MYAIERDDFRHQTGGRPQFLGYSRLLTNELEPRAAEDAGF